jgi:rubrerythrin
MLYKNSRTIENISNAFAGEAQAYLKYLFFATKCREQGFNEVAEVFENTAKQEYIHAQAHLNLLFAKDLTAIQCLEIAIAGETYEYEIMYPQFKKEAEIECNILALHELNEQIEESKEHAQIFNSVLLKAQKIFNALGNVEKIHAQHYINILNTTTKGEKI